MKATSAEALVACNRQSLDLIVRRAEGSVEERASHQWTQDPSDAVVCCGCWSSRLGAFFERRRGENVTDSGL